MTSYYRHHLKSLRGDVITSWRDWPQTTEVLSEVASWADCEPDEVAEIETPGGDFLTVDGIPVAYVEHVAHREALLRIARLPMAAV